MCSNALDSTILSSRTEDHSSLQNSPENLPDSSDTMFTFPLPIILRPTDRPNKPIKKYKLMYLHIFCANNPHQWSKCLTSAEFLHNSVPHSSTKVSPFSLLLGYDSRSYPSLGKTFLPTLDSCLSSLDLARKEALAAHESARQIMIEQSS